MHEDLLGYLLGALSADEQRRIKGALAIDPQLRCALERLRRSLEPLDSLRGDQDPPPGITDRTLQAIERHDETCRPTLRGGIQSRTMSRDTASRNRSIAQSHIRGISDGIVLALVGLTAITLFLPALANSRYTARKDACQDNMRVIGGMLIDDSLRHGGKFVPIPISGNQAFAGHFASKLLDRHMISCNTTALLCPGVQWREDSRPWYVPTLEQIDSASGPELDRLQQMAGGSYAYVVGYVDDQGRYQAIRNQNRPYFPILADVPSLHLKGRQSANHGGRGQNLFYEDGHVTFITELKRLVRDDPWRNRQGHAEAGNGCDDAVLLRSEWPPIVLGAESALEVITEPLR